MVVKATDLKLGNIIVNSNNEELEVTMISLDIDDEYNELIGVVKKGETNNELEFEQREGKLYYKKLTNKNIQELGFNNLGRFYKYPQLFQCVHDSDGLFVKFRNLDIPLQIRYYHELQNIINDLKL